MSLTYKGLAGMSVRTPGFLLPPLFFSSSKNAFYCCFVNAINAHETEEFSELEYVFALTLL